MGTFHCGDFPGTQLTGDLSVDLELTREIINLIRPASTSEISHGKLENATRETNVCLTCCHGNVDKRKKMLG